MEDEFRAFATYAQLSPSGSAFLVATTQVNDPAEVSVRRTDQNAPLWRFEGGRGLRNLDGAAVSDDGQFVATTDDDGNVVLHQRGRERRWPRDERVLGALQTSFAPHQHLWATTWSRPGVEAGTHLEVWSDAGRVAFLEGGGWHAWDQITLLFVAHDGVRRWRADGSVALVYPLKQPPPALYRARRVFFSATPKHVVVIDERRFSVFQLADGRRCADAEFNEAVITHAVSGNTAQVFTAGGRVLEIAFDTGAIRVLDTFGPMTYRVSSWMFQSSLNDHYIPTFSPDGRFLFVDYPESKLVVYRYD